MLEDLAWLLEDLAVSAGATVAVFLLHCHSLRLSLSLLRLSRRDVRDLRCNVLTLGHPRLRHE